MKGAVKRASQDLSIDVISEVAKIVTAQTGVQLGPKQRPMIVSRIHRRISELGLRDEFDYLEHLKGNFAEEGKALVSLLTTHHTYFFREYAHFEFLAKGGLEKIVEGAKKEGRRKVRVWSAACSRGQESYSLSMFLAHHLKDIAPDFDYEIFGSDVDEQSVLFARNGVYPWNDVKGIPALYLANHWARGRGDISEFVKAKPSIKSKCRFEALNLTQLDKIPKSEKFDLIFCRNVFIYFSQEQIKSSVMALVEHLTEEGLLFLGMTESISSYGLPLGLAGPSIYSRGLKNEKAREKPGGKTDIHAPSSVSRPLRVFCVDDSPVILSLLKRILTKERGFEVVGTAENGRSAAEKLKLQPVDVVTLDIHMPEMTGVEYLKKHHTAFHPPVVMISSVRREDADLAIKALECGAIDYVEKPELSNLDISGDEIRSKLLNAFRYKQEKRERRPLQLEKSFSSKSHLTLTGDQLRVILASVSDREKIISLIGEMQESPQPPTLILFEGLPAIIHEVSSLLTSKGGKMAIEAYDASREPRQMKANHVYVADFKGAIEAIKAEKAFNKVCVLVYGEASEGAARAISSWAGIHLILEEASSGLTASRKRLLLKAKDIVSWPSFGYLSLDCFRSGL